MIDVLTSSDRDRYPDYFEEIFRLRHEVFHERLGWDVKSINGMEIDEFDDLDAVYFGCRGPEGRLDACWRLLPTTGPYMLSNTFPFLMDDQPIPHSPKVWEASRFAVSGQLLEKKCLNALNRMTAELLCAAHEFGLGIGMTELVTVCDIGVKRLVQRMGCNALWSTRPKRIGNTITVAAGYEISPYEQDKLRAMFGFKGSILGTIVPAETRVAA